MRDLRCEHIRAPLGKNGLRFLQLLNTAPMSVPRVEVVTGISRDTVRDGLQRLMRRGLIEPRGRSMEGCYKPAMTFGLTAAGLAIVETGGGDVEAGSVDLVAPSVTVRRRTQSGSGVIAPRPYATGLACWGRGNSFV